MNPDYRRDIEAVARLAERDGHFAAAAAWRSGAAAFEAGRTSAHRWGEARRILGGTGGYARRVEEARR